ncbi:amidohydrolase [Thalassotalea fusca]
MLLSLKNNTLNKTSKEKTTYGLCTFFLSAVLLVASTSSSAKNTLLLADSTNSQTATEIFIHGSIYTVNPKQPWAEAVALRDNRIIYVGTSADALKLANDKTSITNLNGKMMLPGFHDVHMHPIESASENTLFTLNTEETDPENFADTIADAAENNPSADWLIGYGHTIATLLDAERLPIDIIDDVVPDRPVIIMEQTSHSMWVNSAAMEIAGIDIDSPDPIGGVILRDELTGEPNGILIDNAGNLVMDIAMRPTAKRQQKDYEGLIEYTLPELAKHGITSISDARSFWQRDDHLTWIKASDNEELTARVNVGLWAYPNMTDTEQLAKLKSMYSNDSDSYLKFNQIKLYSDGILVNGTAAMLAPYNVDLIGLAGNRGLNYFDQARLAYYIKELETVGFDFNIHAIGDRGIHEALNAIEKASFGKGRHRLTHLEVIAPKDLARFAKLNVIADAQVAGEFTNPAHWEENVGLLGRIRANNAVPIKSLVQANARLTLSSDWNVSPFNPFIGLQNAITRAPQNISLADAIKAYTLNSAYAMRQEDKVGSIEVGKLADLIVIDRNLFEVDKEDINQTKVLMTYFDGELIYRK